MQFEFDIPDNNNIPELTNNQPKNWMIMKKDEVSKEKAIKNILSKKVT